MKKDLVLAVIAVLVVAAVCYGLAAVRPPFQPRQSQPFSIGPTPSAPAGRIVIRVNGEPVTQAEFEASFNILPDEIKRQYASEPGKLAFAEQLVRMKLLEQEAHRLGLENDPNIAGQLAARRTDLLADAAAEKITPQPSLQALQEYYAKNKEKFETVDLSHILIAYQGGMVPPRQGRALDENEAMNKALYVYDRLQKGEDFAEAARAYSDDVQSAAKGGEIGPVGHGMLPGTLDARVFQLKVGQFTTPIPSRLGIHIFKVNGRGTRSLDELRAGVAQRLRQQDMGDRVEALRKRANVIFDQKFFPTMTQTPPKKKSS